MKKSMQNLNDSLNSMNSGKMTDIKERETCEHSSSQLFIIYTNRYKQDAAREHSKLHFPICCSFLTQPFSGRVTNVYKLFVLSFTHFVLMQARPHFAQFQQELGSTAALMLEVMEKRAPSETLTYS